MKRIGGITKDYAWGSHTYLAEMRGMSASPHPEAELWLGSHPGGPAIVESTGGTLADEIAADPEGQLGQPLIERFGSELPYLLKILAAAEPLSIQVHPSIEQAEAGFAKEDAAGIDRAAPDRCFRDANHKPELVFALTNFDALVGFRPIDESISALEAFDVAALKPVIDELETNGLGGVLDLLLTMPVADATAMVDEVVAAAETLPASHARDAELVARLNRAHPSDIGVVNGLLLNYRTLVPGEALYLDAGVLHAYLGGLAVEIMANSDNVVRGGLTPKHIDVPTLLELVAPEPLEPNVLRGVGTHSTFDTPAADFALTQFDQPEHVERTLQGPEIVLCLSGTITVSANGSTEDLQATEAVWVPAADGHLVVSGAGTAVVASVGDLSR